MGIEDLCLDQGSIFRARARGFKRLKEAALSQGTGGIVCRILKCRDAAHQSRNRDTPVSINLFKRKADLNMVVHFE